MFLIKQGRANLAPHEARTITMTTLQSSNGASDPKADILLLTATTVEARAVLDTFARESGKPFQRHFLDDKTYFDLGVFGGARVMMVRSEMGAGGPGGALLVADEGIRRLSPSAVIMVGIAFGLDEEKRKIGDILVAKQLIGYELQKVASDGRGRRKVILRDDRPYASIRLLDRFRSGVLDWQGPEVEFGPVLTGDKLVDNQFFRDQLHKFAHEAIGGEMEGAGLYSAAQRRKVDWILVKAICDWADGNKERDKTAHQQLAAENAARFTLHVLKQGGFAEQTPNFIPPGTRNQKSPLQQQGTLLHRYDAHASWVLAVAWEPEGTRIASAGADGTVRIWEAQTGESLLTYRGHTRLLNRINLQATIYTVAWSPEGLRVASAGDGTKVHLWNAATGQTLILYHDHTGLLPNVFAVAWSPDGKQVASACSSTGLDKTIHIWNALTGQTLNRYDTHYGRVLPNFSVLSLAWSPDGTRLAASGDKAIRVWNSTTGKLISTHRFHAEWSSHIAWSPDSRYLASAHSNHTVQIWEVATETVVMTYHGHTDSVRCAAWSPDGVHIASAANDRTVHIWEALTGNHLFTYRGHSDWVTSVSWSPDGARIASASNDRTVHIWQAARGLI